jgi:hypothetical protein
MTALMAHTERLVMKHGTAHCDLVIGYPLPQHCIANPTTVQQLVHLTEVSEAQRFASPVPQEPCARPGHNLHYIIPASVGNDPSLHRLPHCSLLKLSRSHTNNPPSTHPSEARAAANRQMKLEDSLRSARAATRARSG